MISLANGTKSGSECRNTKRKGNLRLSSTLQLELFMFSMFLVPSISHVSHNPSLHHSIIPPPLINVPRRNCPCMMPQHIPQLWIIELDIIMKSPIRRAASTTPRAKRIWLIVPTSTFLRNTRICFHREYRSVGRMCLAFLLIWFWSVTLTRVRSVE